MADASVSHQANFGQFDHVCFSITFTHQQWLDFWRLFIIGASMSDCLLFSLPRESEIAHLWHRLSNEMCEPLAAGVVTYKKTAGTKH